MLLQRILGDDARGAASIVWIAHVPPVPALRYVRKSVHGHIWQQRNTNGWKSRPS